MQPIEMKQLKEQIIKYIRAKILKGEYPEGFELVQENIASELGVSRMPVREALQILEQEGYIERMRNRHMRVVGLSKDSIKALGRLLSAMESEIALIMIERQYGSGQLNKAYHKMCGAVQSGDGPGPGPETLLKLEKEFHKQFYFDGIGTFVVQQYERMLNLFWMLAEIRGGYDHAQGHVLLAEVMACFETGKTQALYNGFRKYYDNVIEALIKDDSNE